MKQPSRPTTTKTKKRRTNPDAPIAYFPTDLPVPYAPTRRAFTASERTLSLYAGKAVGT